MNKIHAHNVNPISKYPSIHLQSLSILPGLQVKQFGGSNIHVLH